MDRNFAGRLDCEKDLSFFYRCQAGLSECKNNAERQEAKKQRITHCQAIFRGGKWSDGERSPSNSEKRVCPPRGTGKYSNIRQHLSTAFAVGYHQDFGSVTRVVRISFFHHV
jgi:hypothetical protein